jgi:hypothetical protein
MEQEEEGFDLLEEVFQLKRHQSQKEAAENAEQQKEAEVSKAESSFEIIDTSSNASKLNIKAKEVKAEKKEEDNEQIA